MPTLCTYFSLYYPNGNMHAADMVYIYALPRKHVIILKKKTKQKKTLIWKEDLQFTFKIDEPLGDLTLSCSCFGCDFIAGD